MRQQIAARKSVQKMAEPVRFGGVLPRGNEPLELLGIFSGQVHALIVH